MSRKPGSTCCYCGVIIIESDDARIICNFLDASVLDILHEINHELGVPAIQAKLKCDTQCGSYLPELKR